jgi:hypothetical protein
VPPLSRPFHHPNRWPVPNPISFDGCTCNMCFVFLQELPVNVSN